jgi:DNA-binding NarL/FixJ family response regulator
MIKIFLVDDHVIIRDGLKRIIEEVPDMVVCGEAGDAAGLMPKLETAVPDIVILDVSMPTAANPGLVRRIRELSWSPKVIVFTMFHEDIHAVAYLKAGAGAFISKSRSTKELLAAIRRVHARGRYITPEIADFLFRHREDVDSLGTVALSPAEIEVIRGLAAGKRAVEIARETNRSVSTVNTFVQRIKSKLGMRTVVQIDQYAKENGLI